jgi:hypothetical protein
MLRTTKTNRQKVMEESRRIQTLSKAIARAGGRLFSVPCDHPNFEDYGGDAPGYIDDLRFVRADLERLVWSMRGLDGGLDADVCDYLATQGSTQTMDLAKGLEAFDALGASGQPPKTQ